MRQIVRNLSSRTISLYSAMLGAHLPRFSTSTANGSLPVMARSPTACPPSHSATRPARCRVSGDLPRWALTPVAA